MKKYIKCALVLLLLAPLAVWFGFVYSSNSNEHSSKEGSRHVILISVDGLRSDAIAALGETGAPTFHYLIKNGAATLNARTNHQITITMPNHMSMFTGLPAQGKNAHNYLINYHQRKTVHQFNGRYVPSIFDVAHDRGLRTAFFASKIKFQQFIKSYGGRRNAITNALPGPPPPAKLDRYLITKRNDQKTFEAFLDEFLTNQPSLVFLHFAGPDAVGHDYTWNAQSGSAYLKAVQTIDQYLTKIVKIVENNPSFSGSTAVIVTSDHGGVHLTHSNYLHPLNYTIPFLVWGEGVAEGADLYRLNAKTRKDPGTQRVPFESEGQPIRNSDAANLTLSVLGLPSIPDSVVNAKQDLRIK